MAERKESVANRIPGAGSKIGRSISEAEYNTIMAEKEKEEAVPVEEVTPDIVEDEVEQEEPERPPKRYKAPVQEENEDDDVPADEDEDELSDEEFEKMKASLSEVEESNDNEDEVFKDFDENEDEPVEKKPDEKQNDDVKNNETDKKELSTFNLSPEQEQAFLKQMPLLRNGRTIFAKSLKELQDLSQCGIDFTVKTMMLSDDVKLARAVKAENISHADLDLLSAIKKKDTNAVASILTQYGVPLTELVQTDAFLSDTETPEQRRYAEEISAKMQNVLGAQKQPEFDRRVVADYSLMRAEDTQFADRMRDAELSFPKELRDEMVRNYDFYKEVKRHVSTGAFDVAISGVQNRLMKMDKNTRDMILEDPVQFLHLYDSQISAILEQEGNGFAANSGQSDSRGTSQSTASRKPESTEMQQNATPVKTEIRKTPPSTAPTGVKEQMRRRAYEDEVARINNDDEYFKELFKRATGRDFS